jgi:23S rRNA (cytosine1962-C5)-methyltransferase
MSVATIILHKHKAEAVRRFHPWIFSGAIKKIDGAVNDGDVVSVEDERGSLLGVGHYAKGSIAVRLFSFQKIESVEQCFTEKIEQAIVLRKAIGMWSNKRTNAFRLIHGEGDGLPGLIIDVYNTTAVLQAHSTGMFNERKLIAGLLVKLSGGRITTVYDKSSAALHAHTKDEILIGENVSTEIVENGNRFQVDVIGGQKTGFFLDQRENRKLLGEFSKDRNVLNTFCYTGGFSVYALKAGAAEVHSVDASAKAMAITDANIALNELQNHQSFALDVFEFMKEAKNDFYNTIVLDPPAFAKHHSARHQAIQAYKRLNAVAFQKVSKGGMVFTFSCSQAVNSALFEGAVTAGAIEAKRNIKVIHRVTQPADHPVNIFHPEGEYLKGLLLWVE